MINEYKNETNSTNKEIETIIQKIYNKYTKGKRNMSQIEFKNYFKILSEKDDILQNQSNKIISFRVNDDFKRRMNLIYDKIEQILDLTLNAKNPLGIGNESNYFFNLIINNNNKENNNNEEENNFYQEKEEIDNKNNEENNNIENNNNEENNTNENEENDNNEKENEDNNKNENEQNNNNENEGNNYSDEERKKLNDIIDKNHLQEKEKNNLITIGVLNGN